MLRDKLRIFVSRIFRRVYSRVGRRPIVCHSCFALIEFSLKRFLSFFILIALCPLASRFGTATEFGTLVEYKLNASAWLAVI